MAAVVEVVVGGVVVASLWGVGPAGVVVVAALGALVVAGMVVTAVVGAAVVGGAATVVDVVPAGSPVVVATSARVVADFGGAAVTDPGEVEEPSSSSAPEVQATANNSRRAQQSRR